MDSTLWTNLDTSGLIQIEAEYVRNPQGNPDLGWLDPKKVSPSEAEYRRLFPDGVPLHGDLTPEQQAWLKRSSMEVEAAKSKRPALVDAPSQQRMRDGIKPAQQKAPSADQKKVRRQMAKSAADSDRCDGSGWTCTYESGEAKCPTCGQQVDVVKGRLDDHPTKKSAAKQMTTCFNCKTQWTGGLDEHKGICPNCGANQETRFIPKVRSNGEPNSNATKESSMTTTQPTEAELLDRLATAATLSEASEASEALNAFRMEHRAQISRQASLDWDAIETVVPAVPASLPPMTGGRVTTDTDWLGDLMPDSFDVTHVANSMRAEASMWYEAQWQELKEDSEEFAVASHNAAQRSGAQFGLQSQDAAATFLDHVQHLHTTAGFTTEAYYKEGETDVCHADGEKIEFFDGAWYHLKGGPSHNDVHPASPKEKADKAAKEGHLAVTTGPDAFAGGAEKTQPPPYRIPQGSDLPNPKNKDTFDGIVNGENGPTPDPKTSPSDTPSLGEGDTPAGDQPRSESPPISEDDDVFAKDNKDTSYTDPMPSGGKPSVTQAPAYPTASKSFFAALREVFAGGDSGLVPGDSPSLAEGDQPEGDKSAPSTNPVAGHEFDSSSWDGSGADYINTGGTGDATAGAAGSPGTLTTNNGTTVSGARGEHEADVPTRHDPNPDARYQTPTGKHLPDQTEVTEPSWMKGSVLKEIGGSVASNAQTENNQIFGRALATMGSLDDRLDAFSGHDIVAMVLASADVTDEDRAALEVLATAQTLEGAAVVCAQCGAPIEKDPAGENPSTWHHDDGKSHDHEAKPKGTANPDRTKASLAEGVVPPFGVEGAGRRGNDFSISDAKNEEGEWIMSPEQIRAEMAYSDEPSDPYDDDGYYGAKHTAGDGTSVEVATIPNCDICMMEYNSATPAEYDGKTKTGPWANMCKYHFKDMGVGLGVGRGQKLVLAKPKAKAAAPGPFATVQDMLDARKGARIGPGPQSDADKCTKCHGKGWTDWPAGVDMGPMSMPTCDRCNGTGLDPARTSAKTADGPTNSWPCQRCGTTVERWRGESDVSCPNCNAQYNASGQMLRDDWMFNPSVYNDDIGDMEGYEMQHAHDAAKTAERSTDKSPGRWVAEVGGTNENVWSRNSLTYDTREEAAAYAKDLGGRWFGMDIARVRQIPSGGLPPTNSEQIDPADPDIVLNYRG